MSLIFELTASPLAPDREKKALKSQHVLVWHLLGFDMEVQQAPRCESKVSIYVHKQYASMRLSCTEEDSLH